MTKKSLLMAGFAGAAALTLVAAQAQMRQTPQQAPQTTGQAQQNQQGQQKASKADQKFMTEAMQGDMAEVQIGKLAQEKSQNQDVKQFGQTLEQDHNQNLQQAQQVAQQLGVNPPSGPSAQQKATYDKLSKLSGAKFDREFKQAMVKDHKEDISKFRKEENKSGAVGNFAKQTLPTLQKHLQMAEQLKPETATTGSASSSEKRHSRHSHRY
ncbi:MAG TPA: DUF4142 domain-containing protein [Pseudolabrys sp.]|jgi:putative membrane protein|nr:DUF4142 domain-containing protein [Pseudolabrys sp.]